MCSSSPSSSSCRKEGHCDIQSWNKKKVQCCLSCGEMLILASDIYQPLSSSTDIRILKLEPGQKDAEHVGELQHANLKKPPGYDAMSYTWADEFENNQPCRLLYVRSDTNSPSTIRILAITNNCDAALRRFTDRKVPQYLWVDSICIDQTNLLERSEQVELMDKIYRSARQVLIFLSDPADHILDDFEPLCNAISNRVFKNLGKRKLKSYLKQY
jgi:heterokaryon incompatibility protein (HET)